MLRKVEAGPRIFKGGPARNRAVFIISGRRGLGEGEVHREACLADLALCFCAACPRLPQGRITPCERLSVMKTSPFLAGWGRFRDMTPAFGGPSPILWKTARHVSARMGQLTQGPGQTSKPKPWFPSPSTNPSLGATSKAQPPSPARGLWENEIRGETRGTGLLRPALQRLYRRVPAYELAVPQRPRCVAPACRHGDRCGVA